MFHDCSETSLNGIVDFYNIEKRITIQNLTQTCENTHVLMQRRHLGRHLE